MISPIQIYSMARIILPKWCGRVQRKLDVESMRVRQKRVHILLWQDMTQREMLKACLGTMFSHNFGNASYKLLYYSNV